MKVSFKEIDDGLKNEIFVDEVYIGYVEVNLWNQKWKIYPQFSFSPMEQNILYIKFSSFYKAGKGLADLYYRTFMLYDDYDPDDDSRDDDTQPINMRGIWGIPRRRP